jgi:predicted nucleic acid-binding protein
LIYFDTDVLINFAIIQEQTKHKHAKELILDAVNNSCLSLSFLSLQELIFVLGKLSAPQELIEKNYLEFKQYVNVHISLDIFDRAYQLSSIIGNKSINDCIHTALAEKYCTKLITYNKDDFKKLSHLSNLEIVIL